jgi:predicted glutamine amidotransferase
MCRLLGVVSTEIIDYSSPLLRSQRSLAELSTEHPHGWGVAVHDGGGDWDIQRGTACAKLDGRFHEVAARARGRTLIAHVRRRTVGALNLENTHPFQRGRWVFAHNGTIPETEPLTHRTSGQRRREIEGQTDSERLFALLLTAIDRAGGTDGAMRAAPGAVDETLAAAVADLTARPSFGAANFLCGDGEVLYAFRYGRTLHVLERDASPDRGAAVLVASERLTDEAWNEVTEGALLRVDGGARPRWRSIAGATKKAPRHSGG